MDMRVIKVGGAYRHYKGNLYIVDGFTTHTEKQGGMEILVLYHPYDNSNVSWARPVINWLKPTKEGYERFKREPQYDTQE
jgi:hypothetical protein